MIYIQSRNQFILAQGDSPIKAMLLSNGRLHVRIEGVHPSSIEGIVEIKAFLKELKHLGAKFVMTNEEAALWKLVENS